MNEQLGHWFDSGHVTEALLGGEPYFIAETTFRDRHDRVLVVDQLLLWAADRDRLDEAARAFMNALRTAVGDGDVWAAYDLIWAYLLVRADHGTDLALNTDDVRRALDEADRLEDGALASVLAIRDQVRDELAALP